MTDILCDIGEQIIRIFTILFNFTVLPVGKAAVFVAKKIALLAKKIYIFFGQRYFKIKNYILSFFHDIKKGMRYVHEKSAVSRTEGFKEFFRNLKKGFRIHGSVGKLFLNAICVLLSIGVLISFFASFRFMSIGLDVTVNGTDVGTVKREADYIQALSRVKQTLGTDSNEKIETSYTLSVCSAGQITDNETLYENIVKAISDDATFCLLVSVDGKALCFVDSVSVFEKARDDALAKFARENKIDLSKSSVSFVKDVEATFGLYSADEKWDYKKLYNYMCGYSEKQKTYKCKNDDTLDAIAKKFKTKPDTIKSLNPDVDFDYLDDTTVLLISPAKRNLSVKSVSTYVSVEEIPFSTVSQNDNTLDFGTTMTIVSGTPGKDIVSYTDTYVDGKLSTRKKEIARYSVNSAINSLVRIGTNTGRLSSDSPRYTPSSPIYTIDNNGSISHVTDNVSPRLTKNQGGKFIWPAPDGCYDLSQDYYYGEHQGIDIIATDYGSCGGRPIVAVADGIVVTATYHPSWGNYIQIDHGDGVVTGYAHALDGSFRVRVGDYVRQGQQIASIGTTGNSSGYHLHFEVWLDGQRVDPKPYLYVYTYD